MGARPRFPRHVARVLIGQPLVRARQMNGAMTALGEFDFLSRFVVENVHANDTGHVGVGGVETLEGDHGGFDASVSGAGHDPGQ